MFCHNCMHSITKHQLSEIQMALDPHEALTASVRTTLTNGTAFPEEIQAAEIQRDAFKQEIQKVTKVLDKLKEGEEQLDKFIRVQNSLLAPVHRLPVELMTEIFTVVTSFSEDDWIKLIPTEMNNLSSRKNMLSVRLSHVDSRWRTIALGMPLLWSTFALNLRPGDHLDSGAACTGRNSAWREVWLCLMQGSNVMDTTNASTLALLDLFLSRSGTYPLSVRVGFPGRDGLSGWNDSPILSPQDQEILYRLLPHIPRMVHLIAPKIFLNAAYRQGNPRHLPSVLKSLSVVQLDDRYPLKIGLFLSDVGKHLTTIRSSSRDFIAMTATPDFVFPSVRRIIVDPHIDHHKYFQKFPAAFPNLQRIDIPYFVVQGSLVSDGGTWKFPHVNTLEIYAINPMSASWRFLRSLCFPSLKRLLLGSEFKVSREQENLLLRTPATHIPRVIMRSQCQLRSLTFRLIALTSVELVEIMLLTPQLEEFELVTYTDYRRFKTFTDSVGYALLDKSTPDHSFSLLPKLKTLKLEGAFQCKLELLARIIDARCILPTTPSLSTSLDDDRQLEYFRLFWHGPTLQESTVERFIEIFLKHSACEFSTSPDIELWGRDEELKAYAHWPDYSQTTLPAVPLINHASIILAHARHMMELTRLSEPMELAGEGTEVWAKYNKMFQDEQKNVGSQLPHLPVDEEQKEPSLDHFKDFQDFYHIPAVRRPYGLRRFI